MDLLLSLLVVVTSPLGSGTLLLSIGLLCKDWPGSVSCWHLGHIPWNPVTSWGTRFQMCLLPVTPVCPRVPPSAAGSVRTAGGSVSSGLPPRFQVTGEHAGDKQVTLFQLLCPSSGLCADHRASHMDGPNSCLLLGPWLDLSCFPVPLPMSLSFLPGTCSLMCEAQYRVNGHKLLENFEVAGPRIPPAWNTWACRWVSSLGSG